MSFAGTVSRGRAAAERMMVDTVTVDRQDGDPVFDDSTGEYTQPYVQVYSGKARVQQRVEVAPSEEAAGRTVTILRRELQLPMSATGIKVDDRVTVDTSQDPELVGKTFRVSGPFGKTHATARRLQVEEVTS